MMALFFFNDVVFLNLKYYELAPTAEGFGGDDIGSKLYFN